MNSIDCLVFFATTCVLFAEGLCTLASTISEPVPGAFFVRSKRDDGRAMTFSGFYPYGGMSAFASSGDWGQWYKGRGNRRPAVSTEWNSNSGQTGWNNPQVPPQTEEEVSSPEVNESGWKDEPHNSQEQGVNKEEERPAVNKKPKKKPTHHKDKSSEEDEDDETPTVHRNSGGNAAASFNAWFPILLGMLPQEENGNGYKSSSRKTPPQTTIVANSVSHGPGGVASSHAVAYGGLPEHYRSQH